jgi:monothiol glutaredoxin
MATPIRERIQQYVDSDQVVLFMKGTRTMPQCGFSATVVQILDELMQEYTTVNVLADQDVRQGVKDFSDWPTIPQLYVKGEFIGGCDIIKDMYESGQLEDTLGVQAQEIPVPKVTISDEAAAAFQGALQSDQEFVRLEIDSHFNHGLSVGPRGPRDIEVAAGPLTMLLDRGSAKRADGVSIQYVDTPEGKAFKIDNPNEPPGVQEINVQQLKELLDGDAPIELFDVRTPKERELAALEASRLLDRSVQDHIFNLPKDTPLYFICHSGGRSRQAAEFFVNQGYTRVYNVDGGIDAWSRDIDPDVPRY